MLKNAMCSTMMPVVDLARAKQFYEGKLGFSPSTKYSMQDMLWYECDDGTNFALYKRGATKADHTAMSFMVTDLDAEMAELRGKGIKFEEYDFPGLKTVNGVAEFDGIRSAWFLDSEGNILSVGEMNR